MSLRIRRGTDAQRQTLTFDQGEIVYATDTKKIYVGDGVTTGGVNILANSAGVGVTFNPTTQVFDFSTSNLGLTTTDVDEGSNKYFTTQRAQDAAAGLFTSVGSPTSSGTITGTTAPDTVTVAVAPTTLVQGERFVVSGTGGHGLAAGTYYVVSVSTTHIVLASSLANAMAGTSLSSLTTGSITGTSYAAGGTDTGITFTYDSVNHVMNVTASGIGITSVSSDTNPSLGGNLGLNSHNITGTGNINITGSGTFSTTLSATTSLSSPIATFSTQLNVDNITSISPTGVNVSGNVTTPLVVTGIGTFGANSGQVYLPINAAKGSIASPTTTAPGEYLGGVVIQGYTGSAPGAGYKAAGLVAAGWDASATLTDANPKSTISLVCYGGGSTLRIANFNSQGVFTAPSFSAGDGDAANPSIRFTTDGGQDSGFFHPGDGIVCVSVNATEKARFDSGGLRVGGFVKVAQVSGTLPNPPEAGMIVLDGTTFKGYNGSAWVNLN